MPSWQQSPHIQQTNSGIILSLTSKKILLDLADSILQVKSEMRFNGCCFFLMACIPNLAAKPIKAVQLHYTVIQVLMMYCNLIYWYTIMKFWLKALTKLIQLFGAGENRIRLILKISGVEDFTHCT